ncbi:MAG: DUF1772 domain-containing protein [Acidobacteria bacterium]|nr:DUF1772 domain-containing protein [Acidobacteriota bacterium]MBV9069516.1 DUF1772 domain-containing protein [Acidobacteriota bacterium]MBV9186583.1 DUF1772 domain-containing protein [Acidobacteriota bacterium]
MTLWHLALWLLVVALGIQAGAGLFESRVLVPLWASSPPGSVHAYNETAIKADSGRRLWIFLTPITGLISLLNLFAAWFAVGPQRPWWLISSITSVFVIAITFAYFVPVLLRLPKASSISPDVLTRTVRLWVRLNWIRFVLVLMAWLAALKAFSYGV